MDVHSYTSVSSARLANRHVGGFTSYRPATLLMKSMTLFVLNNYLSSLRLLTTWTCLHIPQACYQMLIRYTGSYIYICKDINMNSWQRSHFVVVVVFFLKPRKKQKTCRVIQCIYSILSNCLIRVTGLD